MPVNWHARELLTGGCRVVVTARQVTALTRIHLGEKCSQVIAVAADIEDPAQPAQLVQRMEARLGHLTCTRWAKRGANGVVRQHRRMRRTPRRARAAGAEGLIPGAEWCRTNGTPMVAWAACDSKATGTSHISSLASV